MNQSNVDLLKEAIRIDEDRKKNLDTFKEAWEQILKNSKVQFQRVSFDSQTLDISITGTKHDLEAVWRELRKMGFESPDNRPKATDPSFTGYFKRQIDGCKVYLFFSSTVCRRVKTGTRMVEQDVYETVCGEVEIPQTADSQQVDDIPF